MNTRQLTFADPFVEYDQWLRDDPKSRPVFLGAADWRRVRRYGLLNSIYNNFVHAFLKGEVPTFRGFAELDAPREYGEARMIVDTVRDVTLSGEVKLYAEAPDEIRQTWTAGKYDAVVLFNELRAGLLGDAWFHQYTRAPGVWRLESWDPRFVVVQQYDREIRHVVHWSPYGFLEDGRAVLTALEYRLERDEQAEDRCWWREVRWTEKKPEDLPEDARGGGLPFDYRALENPVDLLAGKGLEGGQLLDFDLRTLDPDLLKSEPGEAGEAVVVGGAPPWYPFLDNAGDQVAFLPVVHVENVASGSLWGLSDLHGSVAALVDLTSTNGSLRDAEELLGVPPLAIEDPKQYADLKRQSDTEGDRQKAKEIRLEPGTVLNGKVTLLDVSKLLSALLEGKRHKLATIYGTSHVPELAAAPTAVRLSSGEALKVLLRPLVMLAKNKRLSRAVDLAEIVRQLHALTGTPLETDRDLGELVAFGDMELWLLTRFAESVLLSEAQGVITKAESRDHLAQIGVLDRALLNSNYDPDAAAPGGLTPSAAAGRTEEGEEA